MTKKYLTDEDKLMQDKSIKWTSSSIIKNDDDDIIDYGSCKSCNKKLEYLGALLWDNSGYVCNDCDMQLMVVPNLDKYYGNDI